MIFIDKIIITKNNKIVDSDNMFTWKFEFLYNNESMMSEIIKINSNDIGMPKEFNIVEFLNHKIVCCMDFNIDTIEIEQVEV